MKTTYILLALISTTASLMADSTFMGAKVGDIVQVTAPLMRLSLRRATLISVTESNIIVQSASLGPFVIPKEKAIVLLSPAVEIALPATFHAHSPTNGLAVATKRQEPAAITTQLAQVKELILGKYSSDPGYPQAQASFDTTMTGVLSGQIKLADLVGQAQTVLKAVEQYAPERQSDPQYEGFISQLKNFVSRANNGEQIVPAP